MLALAVVCALEAAARSRKNEPAKLGALDRYVTESQQRAAGEGRLAASPGSLYGGGRLADLARDNRAFQLDDTVMIVVSDTASALVRGTTATSRKSSAKGGLTALAGPLKATAPLANLGGLSGESTINGQGSTTRQTQLSATLAARVTHVLPNGFLVLEGSKDISVNSERQTVLVRGVCRPQDLGAGNSIRSERLAQLEVQVNGKGVVGDSVRRPFILYRLLAGLLPY